MGQFVLEFIKKFLSGFNVSSSAVIGKWLFYAVVFFVFMSAYTRLNPPPPKQAQTITAQSVSIAAPQPENKKKFFVGLQFHGFGLGIFKE